LSVGSGQLAVVSGQWSVVEETDYGSVEF
jgi:hypothetical protein